MARTKTRLQIETAARTLADASVDAHVSAPQVQYQINQSLAKLWGKLVSADPDRYIQVQAITTTAGVKEYTLAADFMSVRAVDRVNGQARTPIPRYELMDPERYQQAYPYVDGFGSGLRYRIMGSDIDGANEEIRFSQDPGAIDVEVLYVQAPQLLTADGSTFNGVAGWEEYIEVDVAIMILDREESDTSSMRARKAEIEAEIQKLAGRRDAGRPSRIQDTRGRRTQRWR